MINWKNFVIIGLIFIIGLYGLYINTKCKRLERENLELKTDNDSILDSIMAENKNLELQVQELQLNLKTYKHRIDSLEHIKQTVVFTFKESETITEGVKLLKQNIECENY